MPCLALFGEDLVFLISRCAVRCDWGSLQDCALSEKHLFLADGVEIASFEAERDFPFRSAERLANCSFRVVTVSAGKDGNALNIAP